jgi:hypothetical protein
VQATLVWHPEVELDVVADCTDRIIETVPCPHSRALPNQQTTTSFWGASRNSLAGWQLSALRGTAPSPETAVQASSRDPNSSGRDRPSRPRNCRHYNRSPRRHDTLRTCWYQQRFGNRAQTIARPARKASRETKKADVSGGERLHYSHRPPLHHRQIH